MNWFPALRFRPFAFGRGELFWMRLGIALLAIYAITGRVYETGQPDPVGLARWIDFTFLGRSEPLWRIALFGLDIPFHWWTLAVAAGMALYVSGRLVAPGLLVATFFVLGYGALKNSQGAATHHLQGLALVLLVQAACYAWRAVAGRGEVDPDPSARRLETHRTAAWMGMQAFVASYVVTAVTKLVRSEFGWIRDAEFFPLQLEKARMSDYYNVLEILPGSGGWFDRMTVALTDAFIASPTFCRAFLGAGLFLELTAFLALGGRRWALAYGLLIILFHLTVSHVMQLTFELNMLAALVLLVNIPFWIGRLVRRDGSAQDDPSPA